MTPEQIKQIIKDKVEGVWEARHTGSGHRYVHLPSGVYQNSVTTKLGILSKPHLAKWQIRMACEWLLKDDRMERLRSEQYRYEMMAGAMLAPFDIRDDASDVGHYAHSIIERWLNDIIASNSFIKDITTFAPGNCDPRAIAAARGVQKLHQDKKIIPIATEILVGDIRYSCGQLDYLCLWGNEGLTLVDWKSSNQVSQDYILQTVAYCKFLEGMTGLKIKKIKILHLDKGSDKYSIYKVSKINEAWKAFKNICIAYDWKINPKNKLEKDVKRIAI